MLLAASASLFLGYTELPSNRSDQSLAVNASEIAPDEFLGMNKMVVSSGTDALQRVKQSQNGSIEYTKDVAIVHYMDGDRMLTLWTTLYQNETVARIETEKRAVSMRKWGGSWASDLKELTQLPGSRCTRPPQTMCLTTSGQTESGCSTSYHTTSLRPKSSRLSVLYHEDFHCDPTIGFFEAH
jgi:hypothetical protein